MKKILAFILSLCLFCGLPFSVKAQESIQFLSATVTDPESWTVTLTFSAPVTVKNKGYIWLCDRQEPSPGKETTNAYGESYTSWQVGVSSVKYVGDTTQESFSDTLEITFNKQAGYTAIPHDAGIRIVEYANDNIGISSSEYDNGTLNTLIISGKDGEPVSSNYKTNSGVDIAWQTVNVTQSTVFPSLSEQVGENVFRITFSQKVNLTGTDIKAVQELGDTKATDISSVAAVEPMMIHGISYAKAWDIVLNQQEAVENKIVLFGANSGTDAYGCPLLTDTEWQEEMYAWLYLDAWEDPAIDHGVQNTDIESGQAYNFMNCDTGRSLAVDGMDVFVLEQADGINMYYIKDRQGRYLNLYGETVRTTDVPTKVLLYPCANERYRVFVSAKMVLADDDTGETNEAVLVKKEIDDQDISTGWYLTKSTDPRPLRVMPLGDSITYGVNDTLDASEYRVSYREQLSKDLIEYFGRVVFVGSAKTKNENGNTAQTTLDQTHLLRHEGWPGWVVNHIWPDESVSMVRKGLATIIDASLQKYSPDIVCLQIGTNDYGQISSYSNYSGTSLDVNIEAWLEEYEKFVKQIEVTMSDNGTVICSTITPHKNDTTDARYKAFGQKITAKVKELAAEGEKVCAADNYSAVQKAIETYGKDAVFADNLHLKALGSQAMGAEYLSHIKALYSENCLKKVGLQDRLDSMQGTVVLTDDYQEMQLNIPAGVVLDLNGHTVTADEIMIIGEIMDSSGGDGGIIIDKNKLQFTRVENYLPMYDSALSGYRFFLYEFYSKGTKVGTASNPNDTNIMRYGVHLHFDSKKAYELMAKGEGGLDLYMDLQTASGSLDIAYRFNPECGTLQKYGRACVDAFGTESLSGITLVLTITGMDLLNGELLLVSSRLQANTTDVARVDIVKSNELNDHIKLPSTSEGIIDW